MSLSTQVLPIKPKTGALLSWSMRIIGQLPWPGGSFCQVRTPPQRGDFSTPSCLPQAAVLLSKGNRSLLFVFFFLLFISGYVTFFKLSVFLSYLTVDSVP